ncbi:MAG: DUF4197 domain-containing protein [Candidatus Eisenbacteria bacterium]|nr:DUF4197 domain-containing protein [Candidatus Eisenbacteria bacterium]
MDAPLRSVAIALLLIVPLALGGCAAEQTLGGLLGGGGGPLDESTVAAGLKEALRVGTDRTVSVTSALNGFLGNELIRIAMPEQLESMAGTLRTVGLGGQVDEMETAMNRAAELAAGEATDVFVSAITQMTIADAFGILNGGDRAATDYFQEKTTEELSGRFRPIVSEKMEEVGLARIYGDLSTRYNALPFVTTPAVDLTDYVTERALGGLFTVLAQEEGKIREDPAARTTALLKRVFGGKS